MLNVYMTEFLCLQNDELQSEWTYDVALGVVVMIQSDPAIMT